MDLKTTIKLISFEEALSVTHQYAKPCGTERVNLVNALNRTLAEDIYSDISMPPFNKSAMDGYACRESDIKNTLTVIEEIPAGSVPEMEIGENQCARIMTGAAVPQGADFVIMKEDIEEIGNNCILCTRDVSKANICYEGEDVKEGDLVLKKGETILPAHIATLAAVGCCNPLVYKIPTVAIISSGNELVEPTEKPSVSKIRNSNGYQLMAQVRQLGITADYLGIATDDENSLMEILSKAIDKYDVTIISGGVSVGNFDFVPEALTQLNVKIHLHGMKVKPGKHQLFGERDNHYVFGMPGNPVSSFAQFEALVKPFINLLLGKTEEKPYMVLPLEEDYNRKKGNLHFFIPATLTDQSTVLPVEYHGSAHIHSYVHAKVIMEVPQGVLNLKKGDYVRVRPI